MKPIVITSGEPAGVGPDLSLDLINSDCSRQLVVIGDRQVLAERARLLACPFEVVDYAESTSAPRALLHCPMDQPVTPGVLSPASAAYVLSQLQQAAAGCWEGRFAAMLTAPISKAIILASGQAFSGQTEYIAACVGVSHPVMLLAGPRFRVALATTHLPLRQVADVLSTASLVQTLRVLNDGLKRYFPTAESPVIRVCGLNPHAGEGGYIGDEEQRIIQPAVQQARADGIHVEGPFSADTIMATSFLPTVDCVVAMYHDQGLPVAKVLDFDQTVNITLGLPFLRVSPDHGVAVDLAGRGKVRAHSMRAALAMVVAQT